MFVVRCVSPLDEKWEERDAQIRRAAGTPSSGSGAGSSGKGPGIRDHEWIVKDFDRAVAMKNRLNLVPGVQATVRELTSENGDKKGRR